LDDKDEIKARAGKILQEAKKIKPDIKTPLSYKEYLKWERSAKPKMAEAIETLKSLKTTVEKKVFSSKLKETKTVADDIIKGAKKILNSSIIAKEVKDIDPRILRSLADEIKARVKSGVIALASQKEGRISFVCAVTPDLIKKGLHAGKIAKEMATISSGGGGGREDFAMAGGKDPSKLNEALEYVYKTCKKELET